MYEGRGFFYKAAYKTDIMGGDPYGNHLSISIFGDYSSQIPPAAALSSLRTFCDCAVENGRLTSDYTILGHSEDYVRLSYDCPGQALVELLQSWRGMK